MIFFKDRFLLYRIGANGGDESISLYSNCAVEPWDTNSWEAGKDPMTVGIESQSLSSVMC